MYNLVIMKVKVGQLKAHLSKYLKTVRETGEPIEVCLREEGVAYLTPVRGKDAGGVDVEKDLEARLQGVGLLVTQWRTAGIFEPRPGKAGDGKKMANSIVSMRKERDW